MKLKEFERLFTGLSRSYGQFVIKRTGQSGKVEGRAVTVKKQITQKAYKTHLEGTTGLGVVPIRDDNTCLFACIDVDEYRKDIFETINIKIKKFKLPLIICKSKSGGAHLYLFTKEPIPASLIILKLNQFANILNLKEVEIFPKQKRLGPKDSGNWINLPYFNCKKTDRPALDENLKPLTLDEFIKYAANKAVTIKQLKEYEEPYAIMPPCLQYRFINGFPKHGRNTFLFNMAVFLRKHNIGNWREQLAVFNDSYIRLGTREVEQTVLQGRNEYHYQCNLELLSAHCDKKTCYQRQFGEEKEKLSKPFSFDSMQKIDTKPPIWYLTIEGKRIELTSQDLTNQHKFQIRIIEELMIVLPKMKQSVWEDMLQKGLDAAETIAAPMDAGPAGSLIDLTEDFCLNRAPSKNKDELLRGRPFTKNGHTFFKGSALKDHLKRAKFFDLKAKQIWNILREYKKAESIVVNLKGKSIRVWKIEAFEEQIENFDTPEKEEMPF